jgi:hypothetical protein
MQNTRNPLMLVLFSIVLGFSITAQAKLFTSQYCQFELPLGWVCSLEGSEYVCQSTNEERKKEAIIILAAKIRGEQDTLRDYQTYLKKTKTFQIPGGKTQISDPKYTEKKVINGHQWIDSLHLASEIPGFYTRYLATVKEDLGIAVTFSVAKDLYSTYAEVFDRVINSLRVFRQAKVALKNFKFKRDEKNFEDVTFVADGEKLDISRGRVRAQKKKSSEDDSTLYILFAVAALGGYMFLNKNKKKAKKVVKKKKKKKSKDA